LPSEFRLLARDSDFQQNSMRVMKPVSWRMNAAAKDVENVAFGSNVLLEEDSY